ncbi:hypothetical protein GQ53DRAFT_134971 [Thozetella sp. PMI_491]|nr:hypothetical protein GQ53DRAFT_134971 [Thozetella sp. PMI_491]
MSLSKLLRHDLLKTVSAWRQFSKHDIKYFQDGGVHFQEIRLMADCLRGIEAIYSSLEVTLEDWKQLDNSFGDQHLSNTLSAYNIEVSRQIQALSSRTLVLNGDSLDLVRAQKKSGDSMQNLTVISIYFLPLVLASSLFSMTPGTLPFDTTITAFIAVWIILSMTLFLLVNMKDRLRILLKPYPIMDARWWNTFCLALSASFRRVEREVADLENQL